MKFCVFKSLAILLTIILCFNLNAQDPFQYPYKPAGAKVRFPYDDGRHNNLSTVSEWWYLNLHLVGAAPEYKKYDVMLTYFRKPATLRIFNISNPDTKVFHTDVNFEQLVSSQKVGVWDVKYKPKVYDDYSYSTYSQDQKPYSYIYHAVSPKNRDTLDIRVEGLRPPLLMGGTGYGEIGPNGEATYYFSYTNMKVTGNIVFDGIKDSITSGVGWIDRQWGPFVVGLNPKNQYEWFCFQMDNPGITLGKPEQPSEFNLGQLFTNNKLLDDPRTKFVTALFPDNKQDTSSTYILERTGYWKDPVSKSCYSQGWRYIDPLKGVNLYVTPDIQNQVIDVLLFKFWEGSTKIKGTIGNQNVEGLGFAELVTHFNELTVCPAVPENLAITTSSNFNTINWSSSASGTYPLAGYRVYRSTSDSGYWKYIGSTTETSFNDFPEDINKEYYYSVSSFDSNSILSGSPYSESISTLQGNKISQSEKEEKSIRPIISQIFPNPTADFVNILMNDNEPFIVSISDVKGNIVFTKECNQISNLINLKELPIGLYNIQVDKKSKIENRTIVIAR
ncbi:MAG: T9SS type A sorting domain-containing protein [Bacteroidetes bacterium]|nr:T9SS type A sorting domain-containing protein [Bacteroidota bacterium]